VHGLPSLTCRKKARNRAHTLTMQDKWAEFCSDTETSRQLVPPDKQRSLGSGGASKVTARLAGRGRRPLPSVWVEARVRRPAGASADRQPVHGVQVMGQYRPALPDPGALGALEP
jgi:hypothetical protein